jgi:hypothetical protein
VISLSGVVQDVKFEKNTTANSKVATVNHLLGGFYILQIQDEGGYKYLKFIKE